MIFSNIIIYIKNIQNNHPYSAVKALFPKLLGKIFRFFAFDILRVDDRWVYRRIDQPCGKLVEK